MQPTKEQLEQWSKDPNNWKYGIFYYNKEDKRIFPPKRFAAMGFTINFANKKSIAFMLLIMSFGWLMTYLIIHFCA